MNTILLFLPNGLGDLLMAVPLLRRLISHYGIEKITVIAANKIQKDLLETIFSPKLECWCRFDEKPLSQLRLFIKILKKRFDICFCPLISDKLINKLFFSLTLTPAVFPAANDKTSFLPNIIRNHLNLNNFYGHQVNYYIDFLKQYCAGFDGSKVDYNEVQIIKPSSLKKTHRNTKINLAIGLSCGQKEKHKNPSPIFFAKLVNKLAETIPIQILLFGIDSDLIFMQNFAQNVNPEIKITKIINLPITKTIAKLAECDIGISGTTGQGHMMAAAGLPLLITAGVTEPRESGPYIERAYILRHSYKCGPCYQEKFRFGCGVIQCMEMLDIGQAVFAIQKLYDDKKYGKFWLDAEPKKAPISIHKIKTYIRKNKFPY